MLSAHVIENNPDRGTAPRARHEAGVRCSAPVDEKQYIVDRQPYQGASQDSHLRDWPGGGGDSLNKYPVGSCLPSAQKLSFGPEALGRQFRRAVGDSLLARIMLGLQLPTIRVGRP